MEDITRWREDMNFIFEWKNNILRTTEERRALSFHPTLHELLRSPLNNIGNAIL